MRARKMESSSLLLLSRCLCVSHQHLTRASLWLILAALALNGCSKKPEAKREKMPVIEIIPPPPPPPPPPPKKEPPKLQEPPKKEEKMMEAPKEEPEEKPEPEPQKPADEPPPLGTGIKGDGGPDAFGLGYGKGGGGGWGSGSGRGGGNGTTPLGQFQRRVTTSIQDALRNHPKTRSAAFRVENVRLWCDSAGRVTRVKLGSSTGDSALDAVIENDVLSKIRFPEPPPPEARMPIVVKFNARRPR